MTAFAFHRLCTLVALGFASALSFAPPCAAAEAVSNLEVLDLDQAAALLRIRPEVVRELAQAQRVPARRVGDAWRFSRAALIEWLKGGQLAIEPGASAVPPGNLGRAQVLATDLAALSGRGGAPEATTRLAQAAPEARPDANPAPLPTVGERPTAPTAEEIALRDQRALLKRGAVTLDFGVSYSYSEQTVFSLQRVEQRGVGATAALRYGVLNDVQLTLRVPHVWSRSSLFVDQTPIPGSSTPLPPPRTAASESVTGDATVSLLGVALREAAGRPNIMLSVDGVVPTGPGDRGVGAGLVLSKSYDPAVIFAGFSYLRGMALDPTDARRSLAKNNVGLSMGYTFAVNDSLALSSVFAGSYRSTRSSDGVSIPPPGERYQLQLGMTWLLKRGLFMQPGVAVRLGGENPDPTVSLNVAYSF